MSESIIQSFDERSEKIQIFLNEPILTRIQIFQCDIDDAIIQKIYSKEICGQKALNLNFQVFNSLHHQNKYLMKIEQNNKCQIQEIHLQEVYEDNNSYISVLSYKQIVNNISEIFNCDLTEAASAMHINMLQHLPEDIEYDESTGFLCIKINIFNSQYNIYYRKNITNLKVFTGYFQIKNYGTQNTYICNLPDINQQDFNGIKFINDEDYIQFQLDSDYELPITLYHNSKPVYYGYQLKFNKKQYNINVNDIVRIKIIGEQDCIYSQRYTINEVELLNRDPQPVSCEVLNDQQQDEEDKLLKSQQFEQQQEQKKQQMQQKYDELIKLQQQNQQNNISDQIQQLGEQNEQSSEQQNNTVIQVQQSQNQTIPQPNLILSQQTQDSLDQQIDVIE